MKGEKLLSQTKSMLHIAVLTSIVAMAALSFTTEVQAAGCSTDRCTGKIDGLYPHSATGIVNVDMEGLYEGNLTCTPIEGSFLELRPDKPLFREIYEILLQGLLFGKTLTVRVVPNANNDCQIQYVIMHRRLSLSTASEEQ